MSTKKTYYKQVDAQKLSDSIKKVSSLSDLKQISTRFVSNGYEADVEFHNDKDTNQWASCDQIVTNHELVSLQDLKNLKNAKIDARTVELMQEGSVFDNEVFSLSDSAQRNWIALSTFLMLNSIIDVINSSGAERPTSTEELLSHLKSTIDGLVTTLSVTTKDDGEYQFQTDIDYKNFFNTTIAAAKAHYDSGRALKIQVNAATDAAGVDAVIDNR